MISNKGTTHKNKPENPFANASTPKEKEDIWKNLKAEARPISRKDFLEKLEKLKQAE
jgi:hypothetical protein